MMMIMKKINTDTDINTVHNADTILSRANLSLKSNAIEKWTEYFQIIGQQYTDGYYFLLLLCTHLVRKEGRQDARALIV